MTDAPATPQGGDQPMPPAIRVAGQYVKDLSFENPGAPDSLRGAGQPNIDLSVDVQARDLGNDMFEVELIIGARAQRESNPVFIVELTYAGLFQIQNVDPQSREAFLLIECPRLLFPFARRIVAEITREGGFPPLLIDPVDFVQLYQQQYRRAQEAAAASGQTPPVQDA